MKELDIPVLCPRCMVIPDAVERGRIAGGDGYYVDLFCPECDGTMRLNVRVGDGCPTVRVRLQPGDGPRALPTRYFPN